MPGQVESGDGHLVKELSRGVLIAVIDGLGHGPEAAVAARASIEALETSTSEDIIALARRCHERLRTTRGAVIDIAFLDHNQRTLTWLGIGNIVGILIHPSTGGAYQQTFLVSRNGLVGQNLPTLQSVSLPINYGDTLVFATDGISEQFLEGMGPFTASPGQLAQQILKNYALNNDDALVLVVRYLGASGES